jgi:hypothetical protein
MESLLLHPFIITYTHNNKLWVYKVRLTPQSKNKKLDIFIGFKIFLEIGQGIGI